MTLKADIDRLDKNFRFYILPFFDEKAAMSFKIDILMAIHQFIVF